MKTVKDLSDMIEAAKARGEEPIEWRLRPDFHRHLLDTVSPISVIWRPLQMGEHIFGVPFVVDEEAASDAVLVNSDSVTH